MKKVFFLVLVCFTFALPGAYAAFSGVDLDSAFLKATGTPNAKALPLESVLPHGWDGSSHFPPIVVQAPFGACQSFSMTAMMEYIFFHETGKILKLSEKKMAYSLLKLMTEKEWDAEKKFYERKPELGNGIAPLMIETVAQYGLVPEADYPWGDFSSPDSSRSIDLELFNHIFEKPERDYSQSEYTKYLDEAFLTPPPSAIRYTYKSINFSSGKEEELTLRSPLEINQVMGFDKARFKVLHNRDASPFYEGSTPDELKKLIAWFESKAAKYGVRAETIAGNEIIQAMIESLNRRMVVLLAAQVWSGSWTDKLVYEGGGGHAMVVVGYQYRENGDLYFKLRNSWGTKMGIDGYNYVKASVLLPNLMYTAIYQ